MRAARCTSTPKYVSPASAGFPVWMPMRAFAGPPCSCFCAATAAATARSARSKAAKSSSARQSTSCPPASATAARITARYSSRTWMYWSPSRWTRAVESSMSTKRSVTTPLGNGAPVNPRPSLEPGSGCVGEGVVEGVESVLPRHADLERVVGLRVADRDDDAVVVAVPEEGHVDAVVLPICEFFGHGRSLSPDARADHEAARCLGRGYPAA